MSECRDAEMCGRVVSASNFVVRLDAPGTLSTVIDIPVYGGNL